VNTGVMFFALTSLQQWSSVLFCATPVTNPDRRTSKEVQNIHHVRTNIRNR